MSTTSAASPLERLLSGQALRWGVVLLLLLWAGLIGRWVLGALADPGAYSNDFLLFWSAAHMAEAGQAAQAYVVETLLAVQREAVPRQPPGLIWPYPPPALLLVRPLAALPIWWGMAAWVAAGAAAYAATVRMICPDRWTIPAALAFPGAFIAAYCGQTGLFVAAALGAGLWLCERRPWLAGVLLGFVICKPQFGVLLPFILIASGRWKTVAATGATAGVLSLASLLAFGPDSWLAFFRSLSGVSAAVTESGFPLWRMPSLFVTAFASGLPAPAALAGWGVVAAVVVAITVAVWRRPRTPHALKVAVASTGALLTTPYLWDYDTPLAAVALASLAAYGRERPLALRERALFLLLALGPMGFMSVSRHAGLHLAGLLLLVGWAGLAVLAWRAGRSVDQPRRAMSQGLAFTAA